MKQLLKASRLFTLGLALAIGLSGTAMAQGTNTIYTFTMKGTSTTLANQKFKFTASGTMTWNSTTGDVAFNVATSANASFEGAGTLAYSPKGSYGGTSFDAPASGATGVAVFSGAFNKTKTKFTGNFQAASPNRLGPAPGGFVFTTGSVTAALK